MLFKINLDGEMDNIYNLEEYAAEHFNPMIDDGARLFSFKAKERQIVWAKTQQPLRNALLKQTPPNLTEEATYCFLTILKYCGDYPSRKPKQGNELTDIIFTAPLQNDQLRDELFCQLMKQLTNNDIPSSINRCWELMWLTCGLISPTQTLLPYLSKFLTSRKGLTPMAAECAMRLQKTLRAGQRKYPAHLVEVEAIQNQTTQIFHKVYFPDDTDEAFEVESSTKARDFCQNIANR